MSDHPTLPSVETTVIGSDYRTYQPGEYRTLGNNDLYDAVITAGVWPALSDEIKLRIEVDLSTAGYRLGQCWSVEYRAGKLRRVTVVVGA